MTLKSEAFQNNIAYYLDQLAGMDFSSIKDTLGLEQQENGFYLPFFNRPYRISPEGIHDASGAPADYMTLVILSKYLMLYPDQPVIDTAWSAFKDFKLRAQFVNVNYFMSDTERAMIPVLSGKLDAVQSACHKLGGQVSSEPYNYDLVLEFQALPRISLLLLFNDGDEDFPAYGTVLFQRHAEHYLDPESLGVTSAFLIKRLKEELCNDEP